MLSDAVFQILLLLAYLAIGLISVTLPIYAISVNYLPREKWESEKERKKRIENLRSRILLLTAKLKGNHDSKTVAQLKEQIGQYEDELKGTELGVRYLTAKGAVLRPIVVLALALLAAGSGIYSWYEGYLNSVILFGFFSGLFSAGALYNLYKTISAVEYAALRPARTVDFEIRLKDGETDKQIEQMKLGQKIELWTSVITEEFDVENFLMFVIFPSEWDIVRKDSQTEISRFRDKTVVSEETTFLPKEIEAGPAIYVTPKKVGEYQIPVSICGKGIRTCEKLLNVNVVKK